MTKARKPMSFEGALLDVVKVLGYDGCASVLGCSDSNVRKMSDPDIERQISIQNARRLDQAYRRAGGDGAPFLEVYTLQIKVAEREARADAADLMATASMCAKETGEAVGAIVAAIHDLGRGRVCSNVLGEIEEAIQSLQTAAGQIRASENAEVRQ